MVWQSRRVHVTQKETVVGGGVEEDSEYLHADAMIAESFPRGSELMDKMYVRAWKPGYLPVPRSAVEFKSDGHNFVAACVTSDGWKLPSVVNTDVHRCTYARTCTQGSIVLKPQWQRD